MKQSQVFFIAGSIYLGMSFLTQDFLRQLGLLILGGIWSGLSVYADYKGE